MARKSPLAVLTRDQCEALHDAITGGVPWTQIIADLAEYFDVITSESGLRRWAQARGIEKGVRGDGGRVHEQIAAAQAGDPLEKALAKAEYLEGQLSMAERALKSVRKQSNRDLALADTVVEAIGLYYHERAPRIPAPYSAKTGVGTPQEFVAHISDLHYGEVVNPDLTFGISYNPEVAARRMDYLAQKIVRYAELRPYEISKLHVCYLGDMVSGIQHEDLDTTNARAMSEQALEVAELCHNQLELFAEYFPAVEATWIVGNHGRVHKQGRHKAPFESWDYIAGRILQRTAELSLPEHVSVNVPQASREIITVAGQYRLALMHGDGIKAANFAGIPFYSSKAKHDGLQTLLRKLGLPPVDQVSVGHFHQLLHWPNVMVFNGSIKGGDEYVMDTRLAYTPAQQLLQEWHPKYGLTTHDFIDVDRVK